MSDPIRIGNTVIQPKHAKRHETTYEIKNEASPFLMKSISGITTATIEAADVLTLRDYLKRTRHATELYVALCLVHDLGLQLQALLSLGRSIACFGVDDVVVITHRPSDAFTHASINDLDSTLGDSRLDPQFLFLNDRLIFEVDETDGTLSMDRSHALKAESSDAAFLSPELLEALKTPSPHQRVHFKTAYYSAAQLVVYFLLNVERIPADDDAEPEYLRPIKGTSLYWFLLRCLNPVPSQRKYIYV